MCVCIQERVEALEGRFNAIAGALRTQIREKTGVQDGGVIVRDDSLTYDDQGAQALKVQLKEHLHAALALAKELPQRAILHFNKETTRLSDLEGLGPVELIQFLYTLKNQIKASTGDEAEALNVQLKHEMMTALALAKAIPERAAHHYNQDVMLVSDLEGFTFEQLIQFQYGMYDVSGTLSTRTSPFIILTGLLGLWKDINVLIRRRSVSQEETETPQMLILAAAVRDLAAEAMHGGWRLLREIESLEVDL
ncbi:hypothetical protein CC2G_007847 [Coprinopsis cinerea AmutBmut pab1-1]|nr:hypothetical protein CC2G_007847 [Coprinopsis cinerea AmutBmut pab1-1]